MRSFKSNVLKELEERGLIKDIAKPDELDELLSKEKVTLYLGFDLTGKSLHVGNLVPIMLARCFVKYGHKVILLLGGATTKIGDPTGKDSTRTVLSNSEIEENRLNIEKNFRQFFDLASSQIQVLNNDDWFKGFVYIDFLREVGTHFTVNRMISMDSVKSRLEREQSMNFVEFNYMLIQGYDFAHLYENHNCLLQIGGSDQWGNITEGLELISRMKGGNAFALTAPLITRSDGKKMGKSENGAIYLSGKMLSPYEYFQYFRNIPDADIPKMLNFYTELPQEKITFLSNMKGKEINEAKEVLAFEATKICHGETLALEALKQSKTVFDEKLSPDIQELTFQDVLGSKLLSILQKNGAIESLAEGKTLIKQGAVKLNDVTVDNFSFTFEGIGSYKLSLGKKKRYTIIIK